jgi:hypothetical protein
LTPAEVVRLHSTGTYEVYMLGFLPGFRLHGRSAGGARAPRRSEPRTARAGRQRGHGGHADRDLPLGKPRRLAPDRRLPAAAVFGRPGRRRRCCCPATGCCWRQSTPPSIAALQRGDAGDARFGAAAAGLSCSTGEPDDETPSSKSSARARWLRSRISADQGCAGIGVPRSGALEPGWLRLANALLGNAEDAPAIEFLAGGLLVVRARELPVQIALAGHFAATGAGRWTVVARGLLAQRDPGALARRCAAACCRPAGSATSRWPGSAVPQQLGSASTYARAGLGGLDGRLLAPAVRLRSRPGCGGEKSCCGTAG